MSAISNIASSSVSTAATASGASPYAELDSSEFIQIMLSELSNQDPFQPNDSAAILEQLSSLRSIESDLTLQDKLESFVLQNAIGQAGVMIGKVVEGLNTTGDTVTGTVESVRIVDGEAVLELEEGSSMNLDQVQAVYEPEQEAQDSSTTDLAALLEQITATDGETVEDASVS